MTRKSKIVIAAGVSFVIVVAGMVAVMAGGGSDGEGPLVFRVDAAVKTQLTQVDPIEGATDARQTVALAVPGGSVAELVLDEVIVHVNNHAELVAFLGRWNGKVMDSFPADSEGQDYLVKVDVSRADPAKLEEDLLATEPGQAGEHRVSDERALRLLALAAAEWRLGTEVVVDWITEPLTIESGEVFEAKDITEDGVAKNVFDWSYMQAGAGMDTGVAAAWQLLQAQGKLTPQVRYLVMDGGFNRNFDFPDNAKMRKGEWGEANKKDCHGKSCPWHGTDVVLAAMAKVDNQYGTAGPAGPVVSELVVVGNSLDYWSRLRRLESVAEDEHPDVVNLSFTRDVNVGGAYAKKWTDRRMKHVRDTGALIVASAGNDGRSVDSDTLWVPCESSQVMCVGGMTKGGGLDDGSNFGEGDSPTSVEIYGPMCVRSINDPIRPALDFTTKNVCGTSFASPFVGGVAALVMAANPALRSEEVRKILNDTANVGGLGAKVTGSQRRVNALQAVAKALGVEVVVPRVSIDYPPDGKEFAVGRWMDLRGKATDFMGRELKIAWDSDKDGHLADGSATSVPPLSLGTHVLTATVTDSTRRTGSAKVTVKVVDNPPVVKLVSPASGMKTLEGNDVALVGTSMDPDDFSALADDKAKWEVSRNGSVVHTATGHVASVPHSKLPPGSYTVKFTAGPVSAQGSFTVEAIPPGQHKPKATITKPAGTLAISAHNGMPKDIAFAATGTDTEDGTVAGSRFRWTARSGSGQTKVLCTGSHVPSGAPPGGFTTYKNCATFTGGLGIASGDVALTTWVVTLEVFDASGLVGTDTVTVKVTYVTG